jgi:hypothetical protein
MAILAITRCFEIEIDKGLSVEVLDEPFSFALGQYLRTSVFD